MACRFTDTRKWDQRWFHTLSIDAKILFLYLSDRCDIAGFWEVHPEGASFDTGLSTADVETGLLELKNAELVRPVKESRFLWLPSFLPTQGRKTLDPAYYEHGEIIKRISEFDIFDDLVESGVIRPGKLKTKEENARIKQRLFESGGARCSYCGRPFPKMRLQIDHVVSRRDLGSDDIENMLLACPSCNASKGASPLAEWLVRIEKRITNAEHELSYCSAVRAHLQKMLSEGSAEDA